MIEFLAHWSNWLFLLSLAVGVMYVGVSLLASEVGDLIGLDASHSKDIHFSKDVHIDGHHEGLLNAFAHGFAWIGMGKVPLSILVQVLTLSFGAIGLLVNAVCAVFLPAWAILLISFPTAAVLSLLTTRWAGGYVAHFVPSAPEPLREPAQFIGVHGVAHTQITQQGGQVLIEPYLKHPSTILNAHTVSGTIPRDQTVQIIAYDKKTNFYVVQLVIFTLEEAS